MAEFPNLGEHCGVSECNQLDFLPVKCGACSGIFCNAHFSHDAHECPEAYTKNVVVPVCPMCKQPVPVPRGVSPDVHVDQHINNNCEASQKKRIFKNRCTVKGCKKRELVPFTCPKCAQNYCIGHRHEADHNCEEKGGKSMSNAGIAAMVRERMSCSRQASSTQQLSEDEALARALQSSLSTGGAQLSPEEIDRRLAEQLQSEEYRNNGRQQPRPRAAAGSNSNSNCTLS